MSAKTELYQILKAYAQKSKNPAVDYEIFSGFLDKYAEKHAEELPELFAARGPGFSAKLADALTELEEEKLIRLQRTPNKIHSVRVLVYYTERVEQEFKKILSQADISLPGPDTLGLRIDPDLLTPVDIKADFEAYLEKGPVDTPELLNIRFPNISKTMIITPKLLEKPLIEVSLQKIRLYLRDQKNAQYLQHKLLPLFPQREATLKNLIVNAVTKSDLTLQEFMVPSDQTFQFWTQVSSMFLKEYTLKADKLEEEIDLCLAAHIINFYAVYFKGKTQKVKESEAALKILSQQFTKPPYAYTFHDIYNFTDIKGLPIIKRIDRDIFSVYLEGVTTSRDNITLPEILKVKTPDKTEYFIKSDCAVKVLLSRIYPLTKECKTHFMSCWVDSLMNNRKLPEMLEEVNFSREVENFVKASDPLFHTLLNFNLLFLLREQIPMPPVELDFLNRLLNIRAKAVISADKILDLSRATLYREARLRLPFWQVIPFFNSIIKFLLGLFAVKPKPAGKKAAEKEEDLPSADDSQAAQKARYKEEVEALIAHYIRSIEDIPKEMAALISLWNPLLDSQAKQNLIEDVNSLVRDFLRQKKYRSRLYAPSIAQVDQLAKELSDSKNLEAIRDKSHLRDYITLYMLKLLHKI
ncbi:MAG: hypothetical protein LBQ57_02890 [Spirochaetales bacterium]|nr:hypothetical protein [Spirochaetales bacterium]